jgi:hypothetical protein
MAGRLVDGNRQNSIGRKIKTPKRIQTKFGRINYVGEIYT